MNTIKTYGEQEIPTLSQRPGRLNPEKNSPQYSLNRMVCGTHTRSGHFQQKMNLLLQGIEKCPRRPAPTQLFCRKNITAKNVRISRL